MNPTSRIDDDALYPGHVVRKLLEEAGTHLPGTAWLDTATAAPLLGWSEDWLRQKCQRWSMMPHPPVRVQKTSDAKRAHWRLYDQDVYALARGEGKPASASTTALDGNADYDTVRTPQTGDVVADTVAHLQDMTTRYL